MCRVIYTKNKFIKFAVEMFHFAKIACFEEDLFFILSVDQKQKCPCVKFCFIWSASQKFTYKKCRVNEKSCHVNKKWNFRPLNNKTAILLIIKLSYKSIPDNKGNRYSWSVMLFCRKPPQVFGNKPVVRINRFI